MLCVSLHSIDVYIFNIFRTRNVIGLRALKKLLKSKSEWCSGASYYAVRVLLLECSNSLHAQRE